MRLPRGACASRCLCFAFLLASLAPLLSTAGRALDGLDDGRRRTLVVYIYSDTDPEYYGNFLYFLEHAFELGPNEEALDTNFVIVVQSSDPETEDLSRLPQLPANAVYVVHKNECYDWGTYGWILNSGVVDIEAEYTHFIFINCSVRGPYLPLYVQGMTDWKAALLDLLSDEVKLVGPIISCEEVHNALGDATNPHVQSYVVATDLVGLRVLRAAEDVFACHQTWSAAVLRAELGSSKHILNAGYNIASLMLRYRGVDWRKKSNWGCNAKANPFKHNSYDGTDVNIYEAMFIKFKHSYLNMKMPAAMKALQVETAFESTKKSLRTLSRANSQVAHDLAGKQVCFSQVRSGKECFDAAHYRLKYKDSEKLNDRELWDKYLSADQFEDREASFPASPTVPGIVRDFTSHPSPTSFGHSHLSISTGINIDRFARYLQPLERVKADRRSDPILHASAPASAHADDPPRTPDARQMTFAGPKLPEANE